MTVGFRRIKWLSNRSAYQDMQYHRQRRAEAIKKHQDMMDGINNAMQTAQQNRISGSATIAAQAAFKRVQDMAKAKSAEMSRQIDSAQNLIDTTQAGATASAGSSNMLDTVA